MTQKTFKQLREELNLSGVGRSGNMTYLDEASLSRIHQHIQDRNLGTITAHRKSNSPEENVAKNRQLESDIKAHGFGYHHIDGAFIEGHNTPDAHKVLERSYLVVGKQGDDGGKLKDFLKTHGEKYGQDSVIHKPHDSTQATLIGTKHDAWPGHGKEENLGDFHPNRAGEFHSILTKTGKKPGNNPLKKGRTDAAPKKTFAFESVDLGGVYEELGITEDIGSGFYGEYGKFIAKKREEAERNEAQK